jgi:hypothetical protein
LKQRSNELSSEFGQLSNLEKEDLMARHLQSKAERDTMPKKLSNIAVSRAVNGKLNMIINAVL